MASHHTLNAATKTALIATALALGLALFAHLVFGRFFIDAANVGHDYAGGLTGFLAEYYWSISESIWSPPWFTPAFCGGIPMYADPVNSFFALPSMLMRFLDLNPLLTSYLTFLIAVAAGGAGTFLFVRDRLSASTAAAIAAAVIFGLNSFLSSRMLVGHTMYHGLMLVPWLALLISDAPKAHKGWVPRLLAAIPAGWILAYWVYSGGGVMIVAFGLAALALIALAWLRGSDVAEGFSRGAIACLVSVTLGASKISAALAYMASFPRSGYLLPGFASLGDTLWVTLRTLFVDPTNIASFASARLVNLQWFQDRHELEYGLTWVPAALLVLALGARLKAAQSKASDASQDASQDASPAKDGTKRRALLIAGIVAILAVPLLLNTFFSPQWNAFLKNLPLIGSSSALLRWFIIYVPFVAVTAGLAIDQIAVDAKHRIFISAVAVAAVMFSVLTVDRTFYAQQPYDPRPVLEAFELAKRDPRTRPAVTHVGAIIDQAGSITMPLNRQDIMINGYSQLACYIPIFGYRLEFFPFRSLRPGSVFENGPDGFNMKDPACFLFPSENNCKAGDHFALSRRTDLERFTQYRWFPFEKSTRQEMADLLSLLTLLLTAGFMIWRITVRVLARTSTGA